LNNKVFAKYFLRFFSRSLLMRFYTLGAPVAVPVFGDVGADLEAVAEGEGEGVADHFVGEEVGCIYPYAYEMYSDAGRCE